MNVRLQVLVLVGIGLTASSSLGCKRLAQRLSGKSSSTPATAPAPKMTSAPTPTWKDAELTFAELPKTRGSFMLRGTDYTITFSSLPVGAKVTVGARTETASSGGYVSTKVDIGDQLGALAPKDAFDFRFKLPPHIPMTIDFGGPTLVLQTPALSASYGLGEAFKTVPDAPLTFGKEGASPPAEHSIAYLGTLTPEVIGPAKTVTEIDFVALHTDLPVRTGKVCSGYEKSGSKGSPKSYTLNLVDRKVTVYERKTSKVVMAKDFKAEDTCPMMAFGDSAKSYPSTESVKVWLRTVRSTK